MILGRSWFFGFSAALLATGVGGCHEASGTQPSSLLAPKTAAQPAPVATASASGEAQHTTAEAPSSGGTRTGGPAREPAAVDVAASTGGSDSDVTLELNPVLVDAAGKPLGQTEQRPSSSSAAFRARMAVLAQAIISADLEPANDVFFPLIAYRQVKDVAKPERDYELRLLAHFKRDLREYHQALGDSASAARFEGVSVPEPYAKWMAPGSEGNKVGYFRVLRSTLHFALPTGRTRDLELTSMISWRGEWYVVHLHGFE